MCVCFLLNDPSFVQSSNEMKKKQPEMRENIFENVFKTLVHQKHYHHHRYFLDDPNGAEDFHLESTF